MRSRTRARETTLKFLYEHDLRGGQGVLTPEAYFEKHTVDPDTREFATRLIEGVLAEREALDRDIASLAENWRLERMACIDRNVLRIGAWEIINAPDVPGEVVINEAVELAKRYGAVRSGSFVNGILDRVLALRRDPAQEGLDDV